MVNINLQLEQQQKEIPVALWSDYIVKRSALRTLSFTYCNFIHLQADLSTFPGRGMHWNPNRIINAYLMCNAFILTCTPRGSTLNPLSLRFRKEFKLAMFLSRFILFHVMQAVAHTIIHQPTTTTLGIRHFPAAGQQNIIIIWFDYI